MIEYLRPATGNRRRDRATQDLQGLAIGNLKTRSARWRISIAVNALMKRSVSSVAQPGQQVEIPLWLQGRMQSADHVNLRDPQG